VRLWGQGKGRNMFKYSSRYMQTKELCKVHGIQRTTLFYWIAEWKKENPDCIFPGYHKLSSKLVLWDPQKFHDEFLIPYKFNPVSGAIIIKGAKIYENK
jgi:predicted DNA-binding transcriptional regulator AlpA|tara:strand:- start:609 stop:905 length:297 start_codon:yes stop_codon:yes gene_type:complete